MSITRFRLPILVAVSCFSIVFLSFLGCWKAEKSDDSREPLGVFQFRSGGDQHHGIDILVFTADHIYFHYYSDLVSGKTYSQKGEWELFDDRNNGEEVILDAYTPWGIPAWAGQKTSLEDTKPSKTGLAVDKTGDTTKLVVDPDVNSYFFKLK